MQITQIADKNAERTEIIEFLCCLDSYICYKIVVFVNFYVDKEETGGFILTSITLFAGSKRGLCCVITPLAMGIALGLWTSRRNLNGT